MKSREYFNKSNGLIYWLERDAVMVRRPGSAEVLRSNMDAATFFIAVGTDRLVLVED